MRAGSLHPSAPARLAVYALFSLCLGFQAFLAPTKGTTIAVVALFCVAASVVLAVVAVCITFFTHAPLTDTPPPSASSALATFLFTTWVAPFHYFVFYLALFVLAAMVEIPVNNFRLNEFWLSFLVLLALGGCFLLEYVFLYILRVAVEVLPEALPDVLLVPAKT